MASSFVEYNQKGFWIQDGILCITLIFLYDSMSESNIPPWAFEFRDHLKLNSLGDFHGFMHLNLDKYLTTDERGAFFAEIINKTTADLKTKDRRVNVGNLAGKVKDVDPDDPIFNTYVDSERPIKVLDYLKRLVEGKLVTTVSDPVNYSF